MLQGTIAKSQKFYLTCLLNVAQCSGNRLDPSCYCQRRAYELLLGASAPPSGFDRTLPSPPSPLLGKPYPPLSTDVFCREGTAVHTSDTHPNIVNVKPQVLTPNCHPCAPFLGTSQWQYLERDEGQGRKERHSF